MLPILGVGVSRRLWWGIGVPYLCAIKPVCSRFDVFFWGSSNHYVCHSFTLFCLVSEVQTGGDLPGRCGLFGRCNCCCTI